MLLDIRLVDFLHYVLSFGFVDKIPLFKNYQEYKKQSKNEDK